MAQLGREAPPGEALPGESRSLNAHSVQQSRQMDGLTLRSVAYLMAAAGAIRHHDGLGAPSDCRKQIGLGHLHGRPLSARLVTKTPPPYRSTNFRSVAARHSE